MDLKMFLTIFATVFVAELGDKTQLATLLFATGESVSRGLVFLAASLALVASTGLAVVAGTVVANQISERLLAAVAGVGFILIGIWTLWQARV